MKLRALAPGKVIICGEHAVIYGRKALSSSISLHTEVVLSWKRREGQNHQEFPMLSCSIPNLDSMNVILQSKQLESLFNIPLNLDTDSVQHDFQMISSQFSFLFDGLNNSQALATKIFLYLAAAILRRCLEKVQGCSNLDVVVSGDLPLSKGLGSSASVASGMATVFEGFARNCYLLDKEFVSSVNNWAFITENFAHGKASGLDNFTVVYGGLVEAENGIFKNCPLSSVCFKKLKLALIDSGIPKSTKKTVANVRNFSETLPSIAECFFNAICNVSTELKQILNSSYVDLDLIKMLLRANHCCLKALGVSTDVLDSIVVLCERNNIAAKLTGGGGGGMVLALFDKESDFENMNKLVAELSKKGYPIITTEMTESGIQLFYSSSDS